MNYCPICRAPLKTEHTYNSEGNTFTTWSCPECRILYSRKEGDKGVIHHPMPDKDMKPFVTQLHKINDTLTALVGIVGLFGLLFLVLGTKGCF